MALAKMDRTRFPDLSWLADVREVRYALRESRPIWVRHEIVRSGPPPPQPAVPHPTRHPCCEFNLLLEGQVLQFVEREEIERRPGDLFLAGPGVPHYAMILSYPHKCVTAYFLPGLLFQMGPEEDGSRTLRRFTGKQSIRERVVRPPAALRRRMEQGFAELIVEFDNPRLGSEMNLRAVLIEMLTALLRWEQGTGRETGGGGDAIRWQSVARALHYLQEHYAEPIYARQVAAAAGVSESRLQVLFREAMGMPWVRFLQGYRVQRAATLFSEPDRNVTETAFAVGFETQSHFLSAFRSFMGVSPTEYVKTALCKPPSKKTSGV